MVKGVRLPPEKENGKEEMENSLDSVFNDFLGAIVD